MRRLLALVALLALAVGVPAAAARSHHARHHASHHRHHCPAHTKRHRRRCVRRRRHAASVRPPAATSTPSTATGGGTATPQPGSTGSTPTSSTGTSTVQYSSRIGVVAREFSLTLSRTTVGAGDSLVQLQNFGEDPHNLRVERVDASGTPTDFPQTGPGGLQTEGVHLSPGTYKLYCTLPGHDAAGMHAYLTVTG